MKIRVGARDSKLSRIQTQGFVDVLTSQGIEVELFFSRSLGDTNRTTPVHRMGEDGVFTSHLESLLLKNEIDVAVHSMKDLPTTCSERLVVIPVLTRQDPRDLLIVKSSALVDTGNVPVIKDGARIATSSLRRQVQIEEYFPKTVIVDVRGNIDTRFRKLKEGWYDALVLAAAGVDRSSMNIGEEFKVFRLPLSLFPTAPAQGQLAVQVRRDDLWIRKKIEELTLSEQEKCVDLERVLFAVVGGGCVEPIGITIRHEGDYVAHYYDGRSSSKRRITVTSPSLEKLQERLQDLILKTKNILHSDLRKKANVVVTKSEEHELTIYLRKSGMNVFSIPIVQSIPTLNGQVEQAALQIEGAGWIVFTSKRAVNSLPGELVDALAKSYVAAVGSSTARALRERGIAVHYVSSEPSSQTLITEIIERRRVEKIVHFVGSFPSRKVKDICRNEGIELNQIQVYSSKYGYSEELRDEIIAKILGGGRWTFVSSSTKTTEIMIDAFNEVLDKVTWVVYGEESKSRLLSRGLKEENIVIPHNLEYRSIVEAIP